MDTNQRATAQRCLESAENGTMTFPQIVGALIEAGFDGYLVDLRRGQTTYYLPSGEALELPTHDSAVAVAARFDTGVIQTAIREAQALVPGYSYRGFCDKVKHAGCAGYLVSFLGRRVLYFGRSAETHVEHFPR
ncbi:MAG TPA: DUF1398 family protein [Polyangiaceae bacterium]|nr:DUF1398 family protein [Polyangiaceae bacterium]